MATQNQKTTKNLPAKTREPEPETTAIVQYGEWSPEQIDKESKELATGGGDYWKTPTGNSIIRFLPPKIGWPSPFVIRHQHFVTMPGIDKPVVFVCPKMHEQKQCLVCDKAKQMEASGNRRDLDAAKKLGPRKGVLSNIIADPKNTEAAVMIWSFGVTVYNFLKQIREDDANGGNFMSPTAKGFNLVINRVGTTKDDTKYTVMPERNNSALVNMDWIEQQTDLRRLVRLPTTEQQKRLLNGEDPRDVWGDGDADEAPRRSRRQDADQPDVPEGTGRTAEDDMFDDEVDLD